MLDLLIHNAHLPDGRKDMGVVVWGGVIADVRAGLNAESAPAHSVCRCPGPIAEPAFC